MSAPTIEIWRDLPGYEGHYQVSSYGRVKSLARVIQRSDGMLRTIKERVLSPFVDATGRLVVGLHLKAQRKVRFAHSLTMLAFVGPPGPGQEICHNDGDPANNCLGNLRYDTHKANGQDMSRHGRSTRGERAHGAKLTAEKVVRIRQRRADGASTHQIGREFGLSQAQASRVCSGACWAHVGGPITKTGALP